MESILLSGSDDKTIRIWNGRTGRFIKVLANQNRTVDSLSISPDGTKVLTGQWIEYEKRSTMFFPFHPVKR